MQVSTVHLRRIRDGALVVAELSDDITNEHLSMWEQTWRPAMRGALADFRRRGVPRGLWPQDLHWDWREKAICTHGLLGQEAFAIVCEGRLQGMMQVDLTKTARLSRQKDRELAYVEFLSAAPWNRADLGGRDFAGVGKVLLRVAVELSVAQEFKGRIGLHSLPQADAFYERCGMTSLGPDPRYHGRLTYFEMTPAQAARFCQP